MNINGFAPLKIENKKDKWDFAYLYRVQYNEGFVKFSTIDINEGDRIIIRFSFKYSRNKFDIINFEAINLESDRNVTTLIDIKNMYSLLEDFIQEMLNTDKQEYNFRKLF